MSFLQNEKDHREIREISKALKEFQDHAKDTMVLARTPFTDELINDLHKEFGSVVNSALVTTPTQHIISRNSVTLLEASFKSMSFA